ncbi:MAG TPA: hypothetical protein VKS60_14605 [Stellaceae bacterium]|nr:hypothetical protein [Stellaceae bacterium]
MKRIPPPEATYHARAEGITRLVDDDAPPRQSRKLAYTFEDMPFALIQRIAGNRMDLGYVPLDALMDE